MIAGKRWELLKVMTGAGPVTIREAARRMERDVKAVHGDVKVLLKAGIPRMLKDTLSTSPTPFPVPP